MPIKKIKTIQKLPYLFFLAGVLLLPFIFWPRATVAYEIPRVIFFQRWAEILGITVLLTFFTLKKERIDAKLLYIVLIYLVICIFSALRGVDLLKSFWGNYYRNDGLFTLFHLIGIFLFLVLIYDKFLEKLLPLILALSSSIVSLWTVFLGFRLYILQESINTWQGAIGVSFGNPVFLGGFLLCCLPFLAYFVNLAKKKEQKIIWVLLLIIQISATFLTLSLGAILGTGLFLVSWYVISFNIKKSFILFGLLAILITALFCIPLLNKNLYPAKFSPQGRERIIRKGIAGFLKKPLFGWGYANFDYAFESSDWPLKLQFDVYVDKAHSSIFETLVTTGLIGCFFYLLIIGRVIKNLLLKKNPYTKFLLLSFLLFIFHSQTNVISISEEIIFWIIAGISSRIN